MRFADLNWMDVESYLKQDDRLMFITGATEQHAYISLTTDVQIPENLAMAAAQRTNVIVAPPLNFGISPYFMAYPGTISITKATFEQLMTEIIAGFFQQGFRRILVLNGHGGNGFELPHGVQTMVKARTDLDVKWYSWWKSETAQSMIEEAGKDGSHANWLENFPFNRVAESPTGEKEPPNVQAAMNSDPEHARKLLGDGSFGGIYQLSDSFMQRFFNRLVDDVVQQLDTWD